GCLSKKRCQAIRWKSCTKKWGLTKFPDAATMLVFYFFAAIVIWLGVLSLRGGLSFANYVRREAARPLPDFTPFATVIAPCRGFEDGLRENIAALFQQDYPRYEIVFVTDRAD